MCIHRHCDQHPKANPLVLLPDCKGWTPLHYACYDNNMKLVLQLRDAGADPNTRYLYTWRDTFCFSVIVTLIGTIHNGCCPYLPMPQVTRCTFMFILLFKAQIGANSQVRLFYRYVPLALIFHTYMCLSRKSPLLLNVYLSNFLELFFFSQHLNSSITKLTTLLVLLTANIQNGIVLIKIQYLVVLLYTLCRNDSNCTPLHLLNEDSDEILELLDLDHLLPRRNDPVLQEYIIEVGTFSLLQFFIRLSFEPIEYMFHLCM